MTATMAADVSAHPAVQQAREAADEARKALREHMAQIKFLQAQTQYLEDDCRRANDALAIAERRARQEA